MTDWWREVWSEGQGARRLYCGIAKTPEGYAVDVFRGDVCIFSETYRSRFAAAEAVDVARLRYGRKSDTAPVSERAATLH